MIQPALSGDEFLADVETARTAEPGALHVWWLGQSGFLVLSNNQFLLLDPYLSDSLTLKYANTDKPHVRMTARVIAPEQLGFVAVATSSHNHTDHLDAATLRPLLRANPALQLVIPEANRAFVAERLAIPPDQPLGLDAGSSIEADGFRIHAVPAAHEGLDRDEHGRHRYLGYIVETAGWWIYHSGDTVLYPGMIETLAPWQVDLALLPINGRKPERKVAGNLWGHEAAQLAHAIGARIAVPCHYEMFEFNTASPDEFEAECRRLNQPYRVLRAGERWTLPSEPRNGA